MIDKAKISKALEALENLNYTEWVKVSTAVDTFFRAKERELKSQLQLPNAKEIEKLIP